MRPLAPPTQRDHYAVLGVPRDADGKRVREAYRRLARRYHPDLNPGDRDAESRLKEINEAYSVLSDPEKRRKYNVLGADWEAILRDERLRRESAGAPSGSASASQAFSGAEDVWTATLRASRRPAWSLRGAIPRRGWVVIATLLMVSCGVVMSHRQSARRAEADDRRHVDIFWHAIGEIRDLAAHTSGFSERWPQAGIEVWVKFCPERTLEQETFLERTLQPNFEKRYRAAAREAIDGITRAEAGGVFALPLPPADLSQLRALLTLREDLRAEDQREHVLSCDSERFVDDLRRHAALAQAGAVCLDQMSRRGPAKVWAAIKAGQTICREAVTRSHGAG
jgi:curved DNA-binding protein CbpA